MALVVNKIKIFSAFSFSFILMAGLFFLTQSSYFKASPTELSLGITADLLLTMPLLYFLLIRKTKVPNSTTIPLILLGMIFASQILPAENPYFLELFKTWIFPFIELGLISYLIYKVLRTIKALNVAQAQSPDFFQALKNVLKDKVPPFALNPIATEVGVFYYGFLHWKKRRLAENEFSYHKESGTVGLMGGILLIILFETIGLHVYLMKYSSIAAWILTFLSIYSGFQLFGFARSIPKRPLRIEAEELHLVYGIVNECRIPLHQIAAVEISGKDLDFGKETRRFSFLGALESHNVILHFKEAQTLHGLYGMKRSCKTLALHVDEKGKFAAQLEEVIS